jgi:hypothetical protein
MAHSLRTVYQAARVEQLAEADTSLQASDITMAAGQGASVSPGAVQLSAVTTASGHAALADDDDMPELV